MNSHGRRPPGTSDSLIGLLTRRSVAGEDDRTHCLSQTSCRARGNSKISLTDGLRKTGNR
eukprot:766245-Hanusia_phi.AAC.3